MDKVFLFTTASVPLHNVKLFFLDNIALHNMQWLLGLKGVVYVHHPGVKVHVCTCPKKCAETAHQTNLTVKMHHF